MESYFEKGRHEHDYVVVALGNFLERSLRNLNYHNIFIGTIFFKKMKLEIIFIK